MFFEYEDYIRDSHRYDTMLETIKSDVNAFYESFHDDPRLLSGWGHGFFCTEDGGRLIYNPDSPLEHTCSICGKVYTDFKYATYFVTMYRNEAVGVTVKAALLYRISREEKYVQIVKDLIGFYADNYKYFAVHAKDKINCDNTVDVGGAGKIMPQGLNEAIIAIRFINAMEIVKDQLEPAWLEDVKKKLFVPMYELLYPQKMHIHNIPIWINSAFGIMGLFFQEPEWVKEAASNPFNLCEQLEEGLTKSGFWYEGSIHYNFFALEGLVTFLVFAKEYECALDQSCFDQVKKMLFAAYDYAFDNDVFPNPSDGWPNISLKTYMHVYCMGYKIFGKDVLPLLAHIAHNKLERGRLPLSEPYYYENQIPLAQLLYAADYEEYTHQEPEKRKSCSFADYNCAVLRNERINVFLKYGHETKSHAHPDKMNIEIMADGNILTKDLSNSGYGTALCNGWHRTIAAHNTCAIDGRPTDVERPGRIITWEDDCIEAEVRAYDDTLYTRRICIGSDKIQDRFLVESETKGNIDWFFHFESAVNTECLKLTESEEYTQLFQQYGYIMDVKKLDADENGRIVIDQQYAVMEIMLEPGAQAYIAKTYNNPADRYRDTIIIRKNDKCACFQERILIKK